MVNLMLLLFNLVESLNKSLRDNDIFNELVDFEVVVNLIVLYEEYVRLGGYCNWCLEEYRVDKIFFGFKVRRDCSCDDNCYKFVFCCFDVVYF